jgi:hypothetical protein
VIRWGYPILLVLAATVLIISGCSPAGYSFDPVYDTSIESIAVPVWDNRTFNPGIEAELTEAVIKEIQRTTRWPVSRRDEAATTLTGVVTDAKLRPLSTRRDTGLVQEVAVQLVVDFTWTDTRTGEVLLARRGFTAAESFVPARPVGENLELGRHAVVQELARDIVAELRSNW